MLGYNVKMGHSLHSPSGMEASPKSLPTLTCLQLLTMPLWVQNPASLPTIMCPLPHLKNKSNNKKPYMLSMQFHQNGKSLEEVHYPVIG
jgi:hypothetical protein